MHKDTYLLTWIKSKMPLQTTLNSRYLQSMKLHENKISKADTCISKSPIMAESLLFYHHEGKPA